MEEDEALLNDVNLQVFSLMMASLQYECRQTDKINLRGCLKTNKYMISPTKEEVQYYNVLLEERKKLRPRLYVILLGFSLHARTFVHYFIQNVKSKSRFIIITLRLLLPLI